MVHTTVDTTHNNTAEIPLTRGDVVVADGETFPVKSITETGLVRTWDGREFGTAEFAELILDTASVRIDRGRVDVSEVSEPIYHEVLRSFQVEYPELAAFITIPVEADEYYLTETGGSGFAIDGKTLVGLFNYTDSNGTGEKLVPEALRHGVTDLMCFDTSLTGIYERWGFSEYDRSSWDEERAPDNWNYERFGQPDVIWMEI